MAIDLGNGKKVLSMTLIDLDTGKEIALFERGGSRCFFREDINLENHIVTLRVDWGDMKNGDPTLDADIYKKNSLGQKGKKISKTGKKWHHTFKKFDENENRKIYDFSFKELRLRIIAKGTFEQKGPSLDAILFK
jgi:hypothetical protein